MGLDLVELTLAVEDHFAIAITEADAPDLRTPRQVMDYVAKRVVTAPDRTQTSRL